MRDISIIVPVYNTEKYLKECLNSLLKQGLSDYEIIIVNDGSTDSSEKIIMEYSKAYEQITYYSQTNHGLGAARNLGLKNSKGKYVYFMDSDDVLEENSLSYLLNHAEQNDLDVIFFDGQSFYDEKMTSNEVYMEYDRKIDYGKYESGEVLFNKFIENNTFYSSVCLQFIKREFLVRNNLDFIEGYLHEDELFTVEVLLNSKNTAHINKKFFKRRLRPNSIMTSKNFKDRVIGYSAIFSEYNMLLKKNNFKLEDTKKSLLYKMRGLYSNILVFSKNVNTKPPKDVMDIAKEYNYFGFKGIIFTFFRPVYYLLVRIKDQINVIIS